MSAAGKFRDELIETAKKMTAPGKGLLAADESTGTIGKRFASISLENTEENRRAYRELLFTGPGKWEQHLSGVILFEETLYQSTKDGKSFVSLLQERGVVPGIKVDKGVCEIPGTYGETFTQGLDGLNARCAKYYEAGARFSKWRAVLKINLEDGCPSDLAIHENAHGLAAYGAISQANGLVPIIEPEILTDGTHTLEQCMEITEKVQAAVVQALHEHHILFEGMLLKPNMVLPGAQCATKYTPEQVAQATVSVLRRTLPAAVPGVCFLSGGQGEEDATVHLNAINKVEGRPWSLTFSYGRALQASVIKTWNGKAENVAAAQEVLQTRARANGLANLGQYTGDAATDLASASLYEKNYKY